MEVTHLVNWKRKKNCKENDGDGRIKKKSALENHKTGVERRATGWSTTLYHVSMAMEGIVDCHFNITSWFQKPQYIKRP